MIKGGRAGDLGQLIDLVGLLEGLGSYYLIIKNLALLIPQIEQSSADGVLAVFKPLSRDKGTR